MGLFPKPRCSLCKNEALSVKVRSPRGQIVTVIFCPRCDQEQKGGRR